MTDIPEWAMKAARKAIAMQDANEALSDTVARALTATHARGHAEGVAQERERAAVLAETQWGYDTSMATMSSVARAIAAAIRKG